MSDKVVPYKDSDKTKTAQVADMFDSISHRYDLLNGVLSLGIYKYWRNQLVKALKLLEGKTVLDVATGTADVAIEIAKHKPSIIIGCDISEQMMVLGRKKIKKKNLATLIHLQYGDASQVPYDSNKFDCISVAYGVRNFENLERGLQEINRVMKNGGCLAILEFSKPKYFPIKQIFQLYFKYILPLIGKIVAKDNRAYSYLPESVQQFPEGESFLRILQKQGFTNTKCKSLTFGIASLYTAYK